jgi:hypothetical protein
VDDLRLRRLPFDPDFRSCVFDLDGGDAAVGHLVDQLQNF